jgi:copper(I)-binding protein
VTNKRARYFVAPIAAAALTFSLAACGSDSDSSADTTAEASDAEVTVTGAWIREPAEGQTVSAAYGVIANNGEEEITLVGASAPIEGTVEIHETIMDDDGTMSMQERTEGFLIPAGGEITLEPGGSHVMIMGIEPTEIVGTIDVTFIFDSGLEVTVPAEVRALDGSMGDTDDGEMDGEMDDEDMEEMES